MVPFIEEHWRKLPAQRKLIDLYKSIPSLEYSDSKPYVEYIQKHALVDVMMNSMISEYYMRYDYMPFNGIGLYAWNISIHNTKHFWNHYYNKYSKELSKVFISHEDGQKFMKKLKIQENELSDDDKTYEKAGIKSHDL